MKNKIRMAAVAFVLALSTLLSLVSCGSSLTETLTGTETAENTAAAPSETGGSAVETDPGAPRKNLRGAYLVGSAAELELLRQHPDAKFVVDGEIDLGGAVWTPIPEFSGDISGLWGGQFNHTIRNFVIEAASSDKAVGFFGNFTGNATDITFADFTVKGKGLSGASVGGVSGTSTRLFTDVDVKNATFELEGTDLTVGAIAGSAKGQFKDCFSSGAIAVTSAGTTLVGGMIGSAAGGMTNNESRVDLTVTASGDSLLAGGLVGDYDCESVMTGSDFGGHIAVESTAASSFAAPLCGAARAAIKSSYSSARSFSAAGAGKANDYVGDMKNGASLEDCWVRDVSNLDETTLSAEEYALRKIAADYMDAEVTIPWKPLIEMTYSDGCSSGHAQHYYPVNTYFGLPYVHQCGTLERMKAYIGPDGVLTDTVPKTGWESWLGNDCADAVYWGWSRVSASVCFLLTNDMFTPAGGTVPVGDYELTSTNSTKQICLDNGEQKMYEAYAACKMADGLTFADPNGHARMVMEAAYVYRNPDGSINPQKSYLVTDEQGASVTNHGDSENMTTCLYRGKYTFARLYKSGYVPVTVKEFAEGKASVPEFSWDQEPAKDNMYNLTLTSNYRINWVRAEVKDASGKTVMEKTVYPSNGGHVTTFQTTRFRTYMREVEKTPGSYVCTLYLGVGNGQELTAATIDFTV